MNINNLIIGKELKLKKNKEMLRRAIKNKDLFYKIICYFLFKFGFSNEKIQVLEIRNKKYKRIKKKYKKILDKLNYNNFYKKNNITRNNNIWICWLQGEDDAPKIVKKCICSIKKFCNSSRITIITAENYKEYVSLPKYIVEKWEKGKISNAHFSDLIRTELLVEFGGTWIDATTYLMAPIPEYVYENYFFFYNFRIKNDITISYNNWFMYSEKDNRILKCVRDLLYEYWKEKNNIYEYFIWQFFMNMVYEKYPEDFKNCKYYTEEMAHILQYSINEEFNDNYWEYIKSISPIQKLTYKMKFNDDSTYYQHIINNG